MLAWAERQDARTLRLLLHELLERAFSVTPRSLDLAVWSTDRRRHEQELEAAESHARAVRALQEDGAFYDAAFFAAERRLDRALLALQRAESRDPGFHRSTSSAASPSSPASPATSTRHGRKPPERR